MWEIIQFTEGTSSFFFSTGAQCVSGIAGLSAALGMFHYQNLTHRIREKALKLLEKYDPSAHTLSKELADKYSKCRTLEESVDFWKAYFTKEARDGHQLLEFNDLYALIKQTRKFRGLMIRISLYGFLILLPLGIAGTLEPSVVIFKQVGHYGPHLAYMLLLIFYFMMNLSLAKNVFLNPWPKR